MAAKLLTVRQVADRWSVHPNTVRRLVKSGALPAVHLSRQLVRIPETAVDALDGQAEHGEAA